MAMQTSPRRACITAGIASAGRNCSTTSSARRPPLRLDRNILGESPQQGTARQSPLPPQTKGATA